MQQNKSGQRDHPRLSESTSSERPHNPHRNKDNTKEKFKAILRSLLNESVAIEVDGKRQHMAIGDALAYKLVKEAASGNLKCIDLLLEGNRIEPKRTRIIVLLDSDMEDEDPIGENED